MDKFFDSIEKNRQLMLDAERYIWAHPETGYKEHGTSAYLEKIFRDLGYELTLADGIPGFYTVVDTGREGPEVLVLAELDSVICRAHPDADKETGAVHSCGHHAQCAALIGIAAALKDEYTLSKLSGKIKLCAVPAEELLEIEYRSELKKQGKIKYYGGKCEFLSRGYFDGVDLAFMVHTGRSFSARRGSNGCIAKTVVYKGKASHAGGSPNLGINALYAASCGLNAVNAIRETFRDEDQIRVHPIVTHGGNMVNAIPDRVSLESYVRGKCDEAIIEANERVNRALIGAALSLGANVEIIDLPGYSPLTNADGMIELVRDAVALAIPDEEFKFNDGYGGGSTDMGDLSRIMPVIHPYARGANGTSHGSDYYIEDHEAAVIKSAKLQLEMLILLLGDGAARAKSIIENFTPDFASKEDYLAYKDSLFSESDRIVYREDGTAEVKIK